VQPQIQGAGAPTNPCFNGGQQYVDTTNHVIYSCPSNGSNWVNIGLGNLSGGGGAFNALTSGTNTAASMTVGTGASISSSGTGTVTATNGAVPAFPVLAQGAKCDGSTDDTTAIQAALTACAASINGGTVVVPAGVCRTSSLLTLSGNGCTLQGQGINANTAGGSTIQTTSSTANILQVGPSSGTGSTLRVRDLSLSRTVAGTSTSTGFFITSCGVCEITNVESFDSIFGYRYQIGTGGNQVKIERARAYANLGSTRYGFYINGQTNSLMMVDDVSAPLNGKTITYGLYFVSGSNDVFANRFQDTGSQHAIYFAGNANNIHIAHPVLDTCGADCISVNSSTGGGLGNDNNITFTDIWAAPNNGATAAVTITSSQGVQINGGAVHIWTASKNAILATSSSRLQINNVHEFVRGGTNTSNCITLSSTSDTTISGNHCFGMSATPMAAGIVLTGSTLNSITGNMVSGTGSSGIALDGSSNNNNLCGNIVDTTSITTKMTNSGTGNACGMTN
jgi:parallel beta-helix repeat protein